MFNTTTRTPFSEITTHTSTSTNFQGIHRTILNSNCVLFAPCCVVPCVSLRGATRTPTCARGSALSSGQAHCIEQQHCCAHTATRPCQRKTGDKKYLWANLNFGTLHHTHIKSINRSTQCLAEKIILGNIWLVYKNCIYSYFKN